MSKPTLGSNMPTCPACTKSCSPGARWSGDLLQDEPAAAEEARADALLPGDLEGDGFLGDEKRLLAADERLAGPEQRGHDRAGKARGEGDMALAPRGEVGDEERAAAERAREPGEEAACGMRVHRHLIVHPGHRVGLAVDRFAGREIDRHGLHDGAADCIAHGSRVLRGKKRANDSADW
jgi:hypothetical protein